MIADVVYAVEQKVLLPVILGLLRPDKTVADRDVLHVGYLTTKPRIACLALRKLGVTADYLAVTHRYSKSAWLKADDKGADYLVNPWLPLSCFEFFGEVWRFYRIVLKYKVIHCHFLRFPSRSGWELPILKRLGRKLIIHYRGCDIRSRDVYRDGPPKHYACQECEYDSAYCENPHKTRARTLARDFGDVFLVTTPDLLDCCPDAEYFPFFMPELDADAVVGKRKTEAAFEVVHATNHEGIDGTKYIVDAVHKLQNEGVDIGLNVMKRVPYEDALAYYKGADLAVGKLMMGFYANSQIESMMVGTATGCHVRDSFRFRISELSLIEMNPDNVYDVLRELSGDPQRLLSVGKTQQKAVKSIHDNCQLAKRLASLYGVTVKE